MTWKRTQGPLTWHEAMIKGKVELGQVPDEKGQEGQVMLRPLKEQHDHIVATKLPKHLQEGVIARPNIDEPAHCPSNMSL